MNAATFLRLVSADGAVPETVEDPAAWQSEALANAKAALARRRKRAKLFGDLRLVGGPAWEMLVDLYVSEIEGKCLCVGSLCITAGVPMTNAVRILTRLVDNGLVYRVADPDDRRRCVIALSEGTRYKIDLYFTSS